MGWIEVESGGLFCPDLADVFVGREALQGLQPASEVEGVNEVAEVAAQLIVGLVVEALDRRLLDGPVHPLDLAVGPGVLWLGQAMIDVGLCAGQLEGMGPEQLATLDGQLDLRNR
jgi:hypothetical protein